MTNNPNPFDELSNKLDRIEKRLDQISDDKQAPKEGDALLTIDEAAAYLKIAKKTLYQYTSRRIIPYIKPGKHLLFKKADLLTWLNSHSK